MVLENMTSYIFIHYINIIKWVVIATGLGPNIQIGIKTEQEQEQEQEQDQEQEQEQEQETGNQKTDVQKTLTRKS